MKPTQPPRPTRRLASLPARIVLFVCTATLSTAGAIGLLSLHESRETVAAFLDEASRNALLRPADDRPQAHAWETARLERDGRLRPS
ncbi:MAG: hypothetical protein HKP30_05265, partial [Myxococcales bacterium]|nr:hypothetical protein [Myxococcales bacterium]